MSKRASITSGNFEIMTTATGTYSATSTIDCLVAPLFAACAWVSLNPFFLWSSGRHMAIAGMLSGLLAAGAFMLGDRPRRREFSGFMLICVFVIYISLLPKVDGTTTRWYFVLPTLLALMVFSDERRSGVLQWFTWIFTLSLIPGIIFSLCAAANIPVTFDHIPLLNPVMAAAGGYYLHAPGALLLASNNLSMPWGGELYRLCAMYDEPGMVGTLSAFILAANRFRLKPFPFLIVFIGGLLSFSLAFVVMAAIGFLYRLWQVRSFLGVIPLAILGFFGLLILGVIKPTVAPLAAVEVPAQVVVVPTAAPQLSIPSPESKASDTNELSAKELVQPLAPSEEVVMTTPALPVVVEPETELRQTKYINNRSLPEMDKLIAKYWSSDTKTILLGLGADSSVVYGGVSQVVTRLLTDFGLIGAALFTLGMISLVLTITRTAELPSWTLLFFLLFALSVYQRPIVWMPYAFTMFICSAVMAGRRHSTPNPEIP
ncbi:MULTISPECIES: hypothetical protein [unclassified Pseudomonas]|uniref:hypothetical protein n=1 Tax=unclassified Pseudomonas TaxID=196821 RepID=UPI0015B6F73E|nr:MULTISPECIES: hypothetical protein [unclassified Pseudomonas]